MKEIIAFPYELLSRPSEYGYNCLVYLYCLYWCNCSTAAATAAAVPAVAAAISISSSHKKIIGNNFFISQFL